MKIDEMKVGQEYGLAVDYRETRHVKALRIVTVPERVYVERLERYEERNVRRVQVEFLDKPQRQYEPDKGFKLNVAARLLIPWSELGPSIRARKEEQAKRDEAVEAAVARLKKVLGRSWDSHGYVLGRGQGAELTLSGRGLDKLLTLAERGKAHGTDR